MEAMGESKEETYVKVYKGQDKTEKRGIHLRKPLSFLPSQKKMKIQAKSIKEKRFDDEKGKIKDEFQFRETIKVISIVPIQSSSYGHFHQSDFEDFLWLQGCSHGNHLTEVPVKTTFKVSFLVHTTQASKLNRTELSSERC